MPTKGKLITAGSTARASEGLTLNDRHTPLPLATVTLNATLDRVLLVPDLQPGESQDAVEQVTLPGGKGLNVARVVHALGGEVLTTGLVAGSCGQWICTLLKQAGIPERFIRLPHGESRTSTILIDPPRDHTTIIHDKGPSVPAEMWPEIRRRVNSAVQSCPWVAFCGSCPSGLPNTVYADLCQDLQARGQRVLVDTRDQWLVHASKVRPYLIKCNQHEAARALNRPVETPEHARDAAQQWHELGIEHTVISLGAQGAVALENGHAWYIAAPPIQALCPVGSGDTMMAGLIVALNRGEPLPVATQYGVALGAANTLRLGSGCFDLDAVPSLLKKTKVTRINKAARR